MPFATSTIAQRLLDSVMGTIPLLKGPRPPKSILRPVWANAECSRQDQIAIRDAIDQFQLDYVPQIYNWPGAGPDLANELAGMSIDSIDILCGTDCQPPNTLSASSLSAKHSGKVKYTMMICADNSSPDIAFSPSRRATLIKGLVFLQFMALAGGNAVDSYGLYAYFVMTDRNNVAISGETSPSLSMRQLMCTDCRQIGMTWKAGKYMVWNNVSGSFWIGDKVNPMAPAANVLAGQLLYPNWRCACTNGGC